MNCGSSARPFSACTLWLVGVVATSGVETFPVLVQELDRHMRITVQLRGRPDHVVLQSQMGDMRVPVIEADQKTFAGKRVLLTLSKNNRLEWICDWIRFHQDHHGANAVLLYDNNSTLYSLDELASAIANLPGIEATKVIHWPYKYGPQGHGGGFWDSDFCQSGALEDARWRYLQRARSVLNVDIDELVLPRSQSVFERVEAGPPATSRLGDSGWSTRAVTRANVLKPSHCCIEVILYG